MPNSNAYSERLGAISDIQFQQVCDRLDLGAFTSAAPTTSGLFGQNVFLFTTGGDYVLRGAPHWVRGLDEDQYRREDRWQFTKETWFAHQLHEHTAAPIPWPFLHEQTSDIFGWPFIVMQRTPGLCLDDRSILTELEAADRHGIAAAMGRNLAEMQRLQSPFAGDFDLNTIELAPFPGGFVPRVVAESLQSEQGAVHNGAWTNDDRIWMDEIRAQALACTMKRPNSYLHVDYKLNNLTVLQDDAGSWRVSGLFDFHEGRFGDGALDLVRQACSYLDTEPPLARVFIDAYLQDAPHSLPPPELMTLYIVSDRIKLWDYFTRPGSKLGLDNRSTFQRWAHRYARGITELLA